MYFSYFKNVILIIGFVLNYVTNIAGLERRFFLCAFFFRAAKDTLVIS